MAYLKMNDIDFSMYVNKLKVVKQHLYSGERNAAGNLRAKYRNSKYTIEVGIIPLDADAMATVLSAVEGFQVKLSFLDPVTKELKDANCIVANYTVDYYTIQTDKVKYQAFSLMFAEL